MRSWLRCLIGDVAEDGTEWTCEPGAGRIPVLVLKDESAPAWTICGQPGISIDLEGDDPCRPV